ncbi:MAG: nuclear transport factor 2 family protein, partial [Eudoraea sp.]|uniref:nuclear transport factor 2 family protein n=1 Tax=Eudoraea sp. TaxID=1979955 RepID=UPI003C70F3C6
IKKADAFYRELSSDTTNSELHLKGIFEETNSNKLALYFNYKWTLKNKQKVEFDVVDIIEFDATNMISKLQIIYDTLISRELVRELEK